MKLFERLRNLRKINEEPDRKEKFEIMLVNSLVEEEIYDKLIIEKTLRIENETETGLFYFRDSHNGRYVFADEGTRGYRFLGN